MIDLEGEATRRKKRVKKYFLRTPCQRVQREAFGLLLVGASGLACAVALFFSGGFVLRALAVVLLVFAGAVALKGLERKVGYDRQYAAAEPKPSDREMDELLAADLVAARERAMRQLGLTADELELTESQGDPIAQLTDDMLAERRGGTPLLICGPGETIYSTIAADGAWRFGKYEVMVICPTARHLALYVCGINFLTGGIEFESTHEYHYVDVVAVRTTTRGGDDGDAPRYLQPRGPDHVRFTRKLIKTFQIVVSSGDRAAVAVGVLDENHPDVEETWQRANIENVVSVVRELLRDKKLALTSPTQVVNW